MRIAFNTDWRFGPHEADHALDRLSVTEPVVLPHNAVELPFNYFDESLYQRAFLYQKILPWHDGYAGREISLILDGAMADARVYLNGTEIARHRDGYTPVTARLTPHLIEGDNLISVTIDGRENPDIPPFGGQIDYLTYAGLYRDAWLDIADPLSLGRIKIETDGIGQDTVTVRVAIGLSSHLEDEVTAHLSATLFDADGRQIAETEATTDGGGGTLTLDNLADIALWSPDSPTLYRLAVALDSREGHDSREIDFGFRTAEFTPDGFLLNGKPMKLRGLNRHQAFPYVGYAMGRRAQERDAEILKHDLKCNVVRTSHYPQSPWFLDHCDRIGLLVFEEIPGWQHIGGSEWRAEAIRNVRRMIERDWNHPSIIAWGVRINESADSHAFYAETNRVARSLDPTRQTSGVRCIENSELLEDVYAMNDFFMGANAAIRGNRPAVALRPPREVTGLNRDVPYIVTEYNGHMYPTKSFDHEERVASHVMRHLKVLDAAYGDDRISGAIGWCMFDYNTHRDFGSGDRICYHGVMDMFREPKFAAHVYRSQCSPAETPVMVPVTYWARGERAIGGILPLIVLTNCEYVAFQYGSHPVRHIYPDRETFPNLLYAPVIIDERTVAPEETGAWGMAWQDGHFTGFVGGRPVVQTRLSANPQPTRLEAVADDQSLSTTPKDATRVILRALDQTGHILPFLDDALVLSISGPGRVIGPDVVPLRGGTAGVWIETTGGAGEISLTAFSQRLGMAELRIVAE